MTPPNKPTVDVEGYLKWDKYFGHLYTDLNDGLDTELYGFDTVNNPHQQNKCHRIPADGSVYGYVIDGIAEVDGKIIDEGSYFQTRLGAQVILGKDSRVVAVKRNGYIGIPLQGGPIEPLGRLRYIDRCSDSLLIPPSLKGDPCFNHLHFPEGIDQTQHAHPSLRNGAVARGNGYCETPNRRTVLERGDIFHIPKDTSHNFITEAGQEMDVIAYHPDSDFGPTHQDHPMINRTWVEGKKMDNSNGVHLQGKVQPRFLER